jgi:RHS repeat-associated protein
MLATVEPDKINYHTPDHLGSPRVLTDASGAVISRRDFLPFGDQLSDSVGNRSSIPGYSTTDFIRQKFTGYWRDQETDLDFAQARHFSGALGRFMQPDEFNGGPVEAFAAIASSNPTFYANTANPQTLNKYQYGLNNPLRYVDPTGHQQEPGLYEKLQQLFRTILGDVKFEDRETRPAKPKVERDPVTGLDGEKMLKDSFETYRKGSEVISDVLQTIDPSGATSMARPGIKGDIKGTILGGATGSILSIGSLGDLSTIGKPGISRGIREIEGTLDDAIDLFDKLAKPGTIKEVKPGVFVAEAEKGGTLTFRASSKSGPPTIDLNGVAPGVRKIKIEPPKPSK